MLAILLQTKMPESIGGYSQIEYLGVFITILFGVVASEFFTGWGNMVRNRKNVQISWLHLSWTIFIFFTLIQNWYGIWPRTKYINHNILYFFYSLVPMFVFYLMTVVLFPRGKQDRGFSFDEYYHQNSRSFFLLFALYFVLTILSSFVYEDQGNVMMQNIIRGGGLAIALACSYFKDKKWLHIAFIALGYAGLAQFLYHIPR